ncbi:ArsR/SmtB family transcription factor [Pseudoroseomonas globiformis]|uniref:ArsR/SmtB family transcription factor n=1 Tax=Teichococcus globiformis TaxID=2307229 RepID=A0ABV7G6C7_9PROT
MSDARSRAFLTVIPEVHADLVRGLASAVRIGILGLLRQHGPLNVNQIGARLNLPQSTVAANVLVLEECALIETEVIKARKGQQKVCHVRFDDIVIRLDGPSLTQRSDLVEVSMPLGLYTSCNVSAPCGLCSRRGVIGMLDVPDFFLDPARVEAALIWFSRGFVEYKFPNNAKLVGASVEGLEFSMELSSEVPGTSLDWPSDISLWVNGVKLGTWTSPSDYGDRRGTLTPRWWKLEGSQYGRLTTWRVTPRGTFFDGVRLSDVTLDDLALPEHHSIRLRIGIEEGAAHPGGVNIFGGGFGNHDQDIVMRLRLSQ